ncbi:MAG: hypothetical protein ACETVZ_04965 [Phycisphaerae bacterium]
MKRISMFTIVMLMLVPSVSKARSRYYGISFRFRIRHSPYAFSHKHPSGLIDGDLQYSPYAFSREYPSGLIPYWFRYSPYAFSNKHPSGLISDYGAYYYLPYGYYPYAYRYKYFGPVDCNPHSYSTSGYKHANLSNRTRNSYEEKLKAQRYRTNIAGEPGGKEIIYNYLKSKNINDFEVDRIFSVDNKTVSVNFVFRDKNLIIKYWNPEQVQALIQQPGYKRNFYEKYEQNWRDFSQKYKQAGGKIYQIEAANGKEILSKLLLCPELSEG